MIYHPLLAIIGLCLLCLACYLEFRYIQADFPQSCNWLLILFFCGGGFVAFGVLALVPDLKIIFKNVGTLGSFLMSILLGGIVTAYTAPRYAKLAIQNRNNGKTRI